MLHTLSFSALTLLGFIAEAYAAIGPVADLHIVNKNLAPDGFTRPTVLAGGTFPGPLIKGNKVLVSEDNSITQSEWRSSYQGDNFKLNVIDDLTDARMLKSTSIVSCINDISRRDSLT